MKLDLTAIAYISKATKEKTKIVLHITTTFCVPNSINIIKSTLENIGTSHVGYRTETHNIKRTLETQQ